jgi:rubredoxin
MMTIGLLSCGLFIRNRLCCPRCGTDFRQERFAKLGRWSMDPRGAEELWESCPQCGVSFDEPYVVPKIAL